MSSPLPEDRVPSRSLERSGDLSTGSTGCTGRPSLCAEEPALSSHFSDEETDSQGGITCSQQPKGRSYGDTDDRKNFPITWLGKDGSHMRWELHVTGGVPAEADDLLAGATERPPGCGREAPWPQKAHRPQDVEAFLSSFRRPELFLPARQPEVQGPRSPAV